MDTSLTATITRSALDAAKAAHDLALSDYRAGGSKDAYNAALTAYLAALRCKVEEPASPAPSSGIRKRVKR